MAWLAWSTWPCWRSPPAPFTARRYQAWPPSGRPTLNLAGWPAVSRRSRLPGPLLASGASSSSVGTYAGRAVMAGFTKLRVPLLVRRALTMLPALAILATGTNSTSALVLSQVVLSFGIPFALVPARRADE